MSNSSSLLPRIKTAAVWLLLGLVALGLYHSGLQGSFFFDDVPNLLTNASIRIDGFSPESLSAALSSNRSGPLGRPLAALSFAFNYYFSGLAPFAFKATNLVIHLLSAGLIFALSKRLFSSVATTSKETSAFMPALALAAIWLLHPIQLLPVLHVVQRMTSLSALFLLAALILHIDGRERQSTARLLLAWTLFWPLSLLSKESGALFPLFALAWEVIVRRANRGGLDRFARIFSIVCCLVLAAGIAYALTPLGGWLWDGYKLRSFSLAERLLTEGRVLWLYIGLILFPRLESLALYHDDITLSTGLLTPWTTLPAILGLVGLVALAWKTRSRFPLIVFGIAWFLIGHALESTALPLEIAHEHRNYLPLLGALLPFAWLLSRFLETTGTRKTLGISLTLAALAYCTLVTGLRADQFGEEVRRTQIEAQHHRKSARAQFEAGRTLASLPEAASQTSPTYSFARAHLEIAAELDTTAKMPWLALIHLNCKARQPLEKRWIDELERRLAKTPFGPGDQTVMYALKEMSLEASLCLDRQDVDNLFAAALANPNVSPGVQAIMHSWHADYFWLREHDMAAARASLKKSLEIAPQDPSNRLKWAQLLFISGEVDQARPILTVLRDAKLSPEERKTLKEMAAVLGLAQP